MDEMKDEVRSGAKQTVRGETRASCGLPRDVAC